MNNCVNYMQFYSPLSEIDLSAARRTAERRLPLWKVIAYTVFNKRIEKTVYVKDKQSAIDIVLNTMKNISVDDAIRIS